MRDAVTVPEEPCGELAAVADPEDAERAGNLGLDTIKMLRDIGIDRGDTCTRAGLSNGAGQFVGALDPKSPNFNARLSSPP